MLSPSEMATRLGDHVPDHSGLLSGKPTFGIRVRTEDEATSVRKIGFACTTILALTVLHFFIAWVRHGIASESVSRLVLALAMPVLGVLGMNRRSAAITWCFHAAAAGYVLFHLSQFAVVGDVIIAVEDPEGHHTASHNMRECSSRSHPCLRDFSSASEIAITATNYSQDLTVWRCADGTCVAGGQRCDMFPECRDRSDENGCASEDYSRASTLSKIHPLCATAVKLDLLDEKHNGLVLLTFTLPSTLLAAYASYISLNLFVMLRVESMGLSSGLGKYAGDDDDMEGPVAE